MKDLIHSKLYTISNIIEADMLFRIPYYQRLYVWDDPQVKTLLEDLQTAFVSKSEIFYLGSILIVKTDDAEKRYDLIDGQQRFTTLWMMSIAWKNHLSKFISLKKGKKNFPRISFAIRNEVDMFFLEKTNTHQIEKIESVSNHIDDAFGHIEEFTGKQNLDIEEFTRFILTKVNLVITEVPSNTDLNKLFEIINNRGVQLQHHEILKARMLKVLDSTQTKVYAKLWDCCSYMGDYLEKNLKDITGIKVSDLITSKEEKENGQLDKIDNAKEVIEVIRNKLLKLPNNSEDHEFGQNITADELDANPMNLKKILSLNEMKFQDSEIEPDEENIDKEVDKVRSIFEFPLLLLHTLRIYLKIKEKEPIETINDKKLLEIFNKFFWSTSPAKEDIQFFIELLWEIRYVFDKYIVKWVTLDNDEVLHICRLRKQKSNINKQGQQRYTVIREFPKTVNKRVLLQSLLYHSQAITTQYWLTPFLYYLYKQKKTDDFKILQHIDNHMFCNCDDRKLILRSDDFMEDVNFKNKIDISILEEDLGTDFPSYWFYKLEFILWFLKKDQFDLKRIKDYRINARNSVEHISPQSRQEKDLNQVSDEVLNHFGNLALVSRSINSQYSHMPFNEKRQKFINLNAKKIDSLKMEKIYKNTNWSDEVALKHQQEMIGIIKEYLDI